MKTVERHAARRLRSQGWALGRIAEHLNVAKSSVSRWVADIALTPEQVAELELADPCRNGRGEGARRQSLARRAERHAAQAEGRRRARQEEGLHLMGCMLHWAEGSKSRNAVTLVNSDPFLLRLFIRFLRECYGVAPERITLTVNLHLGNGLSVEDIHAHWLQVLELPESSLRRPVVTPPSSDELKRGKLPYGTARVQVHSTSLVQSIYGAIQEYGGFDRPSWLDC